MFGIELGSPLLNKEERRRRRRWRRRRTEGQPEVAGHLDTVVQSRRQDEATHPLQQSLDCVDIVGSVLPMNRLEEREADHCRLGFLD